MMVSVISKRGRSLLVFAALLLTATLVRSAAGKTQVAPKPGVYTIRMGPTKDGCSERYLSYNGRRVTMQSSSAKLPTSWLVAPREEGKDLFTITPYVGAGKSYAMGYSGDCSSTTVSLSKSGRKTFDVSMKPGSDGASWLISAADVEDSGDGWCPKLLGCVDSGKSVSPKLGNPSLINEDVEWRLELVEEVYPGRTICKLASNGVTVTCPDTPVGSACVLPKTGEEYIRRDASLISLWIGVGDEYQLSHTCTTGVNNMSRLFESSDLNPDISSWDTSAVVDFSSMFANTTYFNQDISEWNTSTAVDMKNMFRNSTAFNQPIGKWVMSNVINCSKMFDSATSFDQDIGDWDVSNVVDMRFMMRGTPFNRDINRWNTSKVEYMGWLFNSCPNFNQPLDKWNTGNVKEMHYMFDSASSFDQNINGWDTSKVETIQGIFRNATSFNQPLNDWNLDLCLTVQGAFWDASSFDQEISSWNLTGTTMTHAMFRGARKFNRDISMWDMSMVYRASNMFRDAESFNQDISKWDTRAMQLMDSMFQNATAFDQNLQNWTANPQNCSGFGLGATAWIAKYGTGSNSPPLGINMTQSTTDGIAVCALEQ